MSTERTTGLALYDRVAQQLRDQIGRGVWAPGQRIPTEAELTAEFKVSRVTLRKAIAALRDEGLLAVQQGVGTFVQHQRAAQELDRLETLNTTLINQGYEPVTQVVEFGFTKPSGRIRAALQLGEDDQVLRVRRVHAVADGPISVVDLSVPADIGKVITRQQVENQPLYEILPTIGITLGPASQVIRAGAMTKELSELSGIPETTPVLECERLTLDTVGRPIVHAAFTYRSDRFEFHISLAEGPATASWVPSGLAVTEG